MSELSNILLIILDGFGASVEDRGNAILSAKTPYFDQLLKKYPKTTLSASSQEVGLPWGEMGNSEVGHLNIGAGRLVMQEFTRISKSIADKSFFNNAVLTETIDFVKKNKSKLHIFGLCSNGGVHSHTDHLKAIIDFCHQKNCPDFYIHAILDGRDTAEKSAQIYLEEIDDKLKDLKIGQIVSICGRYYAMDRDKSWDRTSEFYKLLTDGSNLEFDNYADAIKDAYYNKQTDEFIKPRNIGKKAIIQDNDAVIFFNYRTDRAIQITKAFVDPTFNFFPQKKFKNLKFVTMTNFEDNLPVSVIFSSIDLANELKNPLSAFLSSQSLKQMKIAETEKFAHVTYFFNSGQHDPYSGEDRVSVPSLKIPTFNLQPKMSAEKITDNVLNSLNKNYNFVVVNFANPDMVGHTGDLKATISAVEYVDNCLQKTVDYALNKNYKIVLTADHGNAEQMLNLELNQPDKEHTVNPVPFIIISKQIDANYVSVSKIEFFAMPPSGVLSDIAPTILELIGLEKPDEMLGVSLVSSLN